MSEIARFHAAFALLELSLNVLMVFALGRPRPVAEAIMFRLRNVGDRIPIIVAVAEASDKLTVRQKRSVALVCDQASKINGRRNVYAHGLFEHQGVRIRVTPFALATNVKQTEYLTLERVKKDVDAINQVVVGAAMFAGHVSNDTLSVLLASPDTPSPPTLPKSKRSAPRTTREPQPPPRSERG
jgi:hypothetical protein